MYISVELRKALLELDQGQCAYCQTTEANSGYPMTVDHIIPRSKEGYTEVENLCSACRSCNEFKGDIVQAQDPVTGEMVSLFHPRQQESSK